MSRGSSWWLSRPQRRSIEELRTGGQEQQARGRAGVGASREWVGLATCGQMEHQGRLETETLEC